MKPRVVRIILLALLALEIALLVFGPRTRDHLPNIYSAIDAGKRPDWWDDAAMGVRYAAWINAALIVVLLATSISWTRPFQNPEIRTPHSTSRTPRWFWPSLVIAAALCLGLRLPLASKSLWWDEAWVIMQASHGKWTPDRKHEGQMKFTAHDWKRCAWYYQKPTNHAPMSLLQKLSIGTWQKITGAKRSDFSDLAARVPALVASCIAVVLLGLLLRAWGGPGAGIAAAFVLAIHPWYIRYGVDARAYALVVPLCISGMFAVTRIYETGARKILPLVWWGATEFLWLWAFPNAVFDIAALNIVAAVLLWKAHAGDKRDRWTALLRLMATNVLAAICFIQMFLPNLMQARRWAGKEADAHVLDWHSAAELLTNLFPFSPGRLASGVSTLHLALFVSFATGLLVFGLRRVFKALPNPNRSILGAIVLSSVMFAFLTLMVGSYYYPRFSLAILPAIIAAVCMALTRPEDMGSSVSLFCFFAATSIVGRYEPLMNKPISPLHDVARFVTSEGQKSGGDPFFACYGLGREVMPVYAPRCIPLENRADLETIMQRAQSEGRELYVTYGYDSFNRSMLPSGFAVLDNPLLFLFVTPKDVLVKFEGLEPDLGFMVLKMQARPSKWMIDSLSEGEKAKLPQFYLTPTTAK